MSAWHAGRYTIYHLYIHIYIYICNMKNKNINICHWLLLFLFFFCTIATFHTRISFFISISFPKYIFYVNFWVKIWTNCYLLFLYIIPMHKHRYMPRIFVAGFILYISLNSGAVVWAINIKYDMAKPLVYKSLNHYRNLFDD